MISPQFKPVKSKRLFAAGRSYDQISWNDWPSVIDAFRDQMEGWYLRPTRVLRTNGDHAFAVVSLCCTLVDTLSQYFYGKEEGTKKEFKDFLDTHFPGFSSPISAPINFTFKGRQKTATTFSEVIYSGFRCGVVHEAHTKLYTGIWGTGQMVKEEPTGYTTYPDGSSCPTIILDPGLFHDHLETVFCQYLSNLRASPAISQSLRDNFKKKFLHSYSIDIGNEP